jgi:hypothetical protein
MATRLNIAHDALHIYTTHASYIGTFTHYTHIHIFTHTHTHTHTRVVVAQLNAAHVIDCARDFHAVVDLDTVAGIAKSVCEW